MFQLIVKILPLKNLSILTVMSMFSFESHFEKRRQLKIDDKVRTGRDRESWLEETNMIKSYLIKWSGEVMKERERDVFQ